MMLRKVYLPFVAAVESISSRVSHLLNRRTADHRDWLLELEEESLSLSKEEKQIAEYVFIEAERQARSRGFPTCDDEDEIFQKMSILKENLKVIIEQFEKCKRAKQKFVSAYPRWQKARSRSIDTLQTIGDSIHLDRLNSNISRLVGHCTSFVGGGLLVASAALIPFTFGLTAPFAIAGGITTALGSATSIGTSITEYALLKTKVEQAKAVINEDKLSFEALKDWLITANSVSEAFNAILSINVDNAIRNSFETIKNFLNAADTMSNSMQALIRGSVKASLDSFPPKFLQMNIFPRLIGLLVILALRCNINQDVFNHAHNTCETLAKYAFSIAEMSLGLLQPAVTAMIRADSTSAPNAVGAAVARGVIAGIGMSLDVVSIVLTSIDVHKGSVSEEGQKIIEAANKMKEESEVLKKVYAKLA